MNKNGFIPEKITYVYGPETIIQVVWDLDGYYSTATERSDILRKEKVLPTFPLPAGNQKRLDTAYQWVKDTCRHRPWDHLAPPVRLADEIIVSEKTKDNNAFTIQICNLDFRGEGGRAYKVKDEDNFYFDLREDVLLETLLTVGCQPNGILDGKFLWCVKGSQIKLIRENSPLHEEMKAATNRREADPIKTSTLIPGGVYQNKTGTKKQVFIGFVRTSDSRQPQMLWLDSNSWENDQRILANLNPSSIENSPYLPFSITKTHQMVEKINQFTIENSKIVETIKPAAQKFIKQNEKLISYTSYNNSYYETENKKLSKFVDLQLIQGAIAEEVFEKKKTAKKAEKKEKV